MDIGSFYDEIIQNEEVWKKTEIQNRTPVQLNTRAIFLRTFDERQKLENKIKNKDNHESDWTSSASYFSGICQFITDFARSVNGTLSRALIAQMKPNGLIYRHIDDGCYYLIRDRYHIVVKSVAGTIFYAGNEKVCMQEGELWWFDNKQHHQVENPSDEWRIHIIFDVLPLPPDIILQKFEENV